MEIILNPVRHLLQIEQYNILNEDEQLENDCHHGYEDASLDPHCIIIQNGKKYSHFEFGKSENIAPSRVIGLTLLGTK